MRAWKAVVLIDLALLLGIGGGYLFWGLRATRLERDLAVARTTPSTCSSSPTARSRASWRR